MTDEQFEGIARLVNKELEKKTIKNKAKTDNFMDAKDRGDLEEDLKSLLKQYFGVDSTPIVSSDYSHINPFIEIIIFKNDWDSNNNT